MDSERDLLFGQIIADFLKATERGETPDRSAILAAHPDLADELHAFFANHDRMQAAANAAFELQRGLELEATLPPGSSASILNSSSSVAKAGRPPRERIGYFGDYELLAEIARGGMGVVYRARQVNLDRTVALKMILAGQLASADDVRRFYQEAEAAASLEHPGIVPVFEVGQHAQQHFFSMGFVEGPNLAEVLSSGPLPPRDAATIVKLVAEAIAYAHDRGVIHRDLKPANVLLAKVDGDSNHRVQQTVQLQVGSVANGNYQPKVTDFGLAKRTESADGGLTGTGQIIGTPSYMSPEQASGRITEVAAVSDVYSLGAILYAALTGHPPFQSDSPLNIVRQVLEQEPVSPRQANPAVPRDLETICLKCLEKDRRKRFTSARELVEELQRFLHGEPIRARRISSVERAWRWCRRKPAVAAVWGLLALLLLTLSLGGPWLAYQEREAAIRQAQLRQQADKARNFAQQKQQESEKLRQQAEESRNLALQRQQESDKLRKLANEEKSRAQENLVASQLLLGQVARDSGDQAESLAWYLQAYLNSPQEAPFRRSGLNLLGAWSRTIEQTLVHDSAVHEIAISSDGQTILAGYLGSESRIWNRATGLPQGQTQHHSGDFISAVFSPDGSFALTADWAGAQVWDTKTGKQRYKTLDHAVREDTVRGPALSPDGKTILTRSTLAEIRLWDAATGKPLCPPRKHGEEVYSLSFSPDSKLALSLSDTAQLWDVATGEPVGPPFKDLTDIAIHPDSKLIAVCSKDKILVREAATDKQVAELTAPEPLRGLQFHPTGKHLLAHGGKSAYLWRDALDAEPKLVQFEHEPGLFTAAFSPDGSQFLTASPRLLQLWRLDSTRPDWKRIVSGGYFFDRSPMLKSARFSPNRQCLLVVTQNETAEVLGIRFGELLVREEKVRQAEFTPDGNTLVVGSSLGWLRLRPIRPELPKRLAMPQFPSDGRGISKLIYSDDGQLACVVHSKKIAQICRGDSLEPSGEPITQDVAIDGVALSPDAKLLVTSYVTGQSRSPFIRPPGELQFWDVATRKPLGDPVKVETSVYSLRFDSTGRTLTAEHLLCDVQARTIVPYKPDASKPQPPPDKNLLNSRLTQDGRRRLNTTRQGVSQLFDAQSQQPVGPSFQAVGGCMAQSADGRYAAFGDLNTLRIWDTTLGRPCGESLLNEQANAYAAFSPDGTQMATIWHAVGRMWDTATGQPLSPIIAQNSTGGSAVQFSPNGEEFHLFCSGLQRWQVPLPAQDEPERLQLSVEVRTGLTVENTAIRKLSQKEWLEKKRRLTELGGPCDALAP